MAGVTGSFSKQEESGSGTNWQKFLTGGQSGLLNQLVKLMGGELGQGTQAYEGQRAAGESPLQEQLFGILSGAMSGEGTGMEGLDKMLGAYDPTLAKQKWEKGVRDPSLKAFEETIMPAVLEPFAGMGALSSGASSRAAGKAGADLTSMMGSSLADTLFQGEQAHRGTQANMLSNILGMGAGMGATQRGIAQQELTGQQQAWGEAQGYNNPWLQFLGTALGTQAEQRGGGATQGSGSSTGFGFGGGTPTKGWGFGSK